MQVLNVEPMAWRNAARPFSCFWCGEKDAEFKMVIRVSELSTITCCVCVDCLPVLNEYPGMILHRYNHPAPCGQACQGAI